MKRDKKTKAKKSDPGSILFLLSALLITALLIPSLFAADLETFTFKLDQSTTAYQFWTTTPAQRVFKDDAVPSAAGAEVKVYAAKNEFEPFQIVVRPASSGSGTVNIGDFGGDIEAEIYQVKYVNITQATDSLGQTGDYPDPLWPLEKGASVSLTANENTAFWFSVKVPETTAAGDYSTNVQIAGVDIPVTLHVFNFAVPGELHVKSQMNVSHQTFLDYYSVSGSDNYWMYVNKIKQYFIDHRLTPKSALWSGGLTGPGAKAYIDYDCDTGALTDNDTIWGFEINAKKYLNGEEITGQSANNGLFNDGTGFPSFMAATFQNNDASADQRPSTFCGVSRSSGDWYTGDNPYSAYNSKWFAYFANLEEYVEAQGLIDKAYYYFANEPQDQDDYDAVAWYSRYLKEAAPDFKLMVSEEPKPEIFNHSNYVNGGQIDIWLPVLQNYDPSISHDREKNYGEESWIYFLHGTRPPYFNPITLDHPGVESKLTGWFLWKYRVKGIAYYSLNNWSKNPWTDPMTSNHNGDVFMLYPPSTSNTPISYSANEHRFVPSIRFELMRDSLEDFEYLYVLNGGTLPAVTEDNTGDGQSADAQAEKIITGLTGYTRDTEFMYNLRKEIGLKNGGETSTIPDIQPSAGHPRAEGAPGNYYINFQDPAGAPSADPLIVNGHEYMKIGFADYDETDGYGWFSPPDAHWMARYVDGPNELQKSIIFSDYGRQATFEFDLPNGDYTVTVSVGWKGRTYSHQMIVIEEETFVNDEQTTPDTPFIVRTFPVTISDKKLTLAMGVPANDEYTMLNYLDIESNTTTYTITPTTGTGGSISPSGAQTVSEGSDTTFTITPDTGYDVDAVTVDGSTATLTDGKYTFSNVTADHTLNVTFKEKAQYTITPTAETGGSISPAEAQTVYEGDEAEFTITPDTGYEVDAVTVDGSPATLTDSKYTFSNVTADHTLSVTFKEKAQYTITPTAGTGGSISPAEVQTVYEGDEAEFTITPDTGYTVDAVTVDGSAATLTDGKYTFSNVTENHTLNVTFKEKAQYTITPTAGNGGSISPATAQTVYEGESLTFTVTPDTGYKVEAFKVDGAAKTLNGSQYTLANVTADHAVEVTFQIAPVVQYSITATAGSNGSISPAGTVTVDAGANQTFTVAADQGYVVDKVLVDGSSATLTNGAYVFTDIGANHTIEASFKASGAVQYKITASASANGSISPSGDIWVEEGAGQAFTVTPDDGYEVDEVLVDGAAAGLTDNQYVFSSVAGSHTIAASFKAVSTAVQYTISALAGDNGSITPSGEVAVDEGSSQTFSILPDDGYVVGSVLVDGGEVTLTQGGYTFTQVTADHTIQASFKMASSDADGDGVKDEDDDYPDDGGKSTPATPSGSDKLVVDASANTGATLTDTETVSDTDSSLNQSGKPDDYEFTYGVLFFTLNSISAGETVTVAVTYPDDIPSDAAFYTVGGSGFISFTNVTVSGKIATLTITDGGEGDNDGEANGIIDHQFAVAFKTSSGGSGSSDSICFIDAAGSNRTLDAAGIFLFAALFFLAVSKRRTGND